MSEKSKTFSLSGDLVYKTYTLLIGLSHGFKMRQDYPSTLYWGHKYLTWSKAEKGRYSLIPVTCAGNILSYFDTVMKHSHTFHYSTGEISWKRSQNMSKCTRKLHPFHMHMPCAKGHALCLSEFN